MPTIRLSKWQTKVFDDQTRYIVINAGRRSGKSTVVAPLMVQYAADKPKSIVWYIAPNYKQAKQIMWAMLREVIPQHAIEKKNETELTITLKNGSMIMLKGAEDPDSLRGVRIDLCIFDECAFINKWDDVWKVVRPTLIDSKARVIFISTPNGFNHFKDMAEKVDPDWRYYHYTSYDNPFIDPEEIDKARLEMDDDSFQQEFLGEFRKMAGLIYGQFKRETHMVDIPPLDGSYTYYRSLDFGYGHNAALGYFAVNSDQTAIYMYDGLYRNQLDTEQLADNVKLKDAGKHITGAWGDSAQPQIIQDLLLKGATFEGVEKGPDSVIKGIANVAQLLKIRPDTGKPTLMFAKHLTWVGDEFEQYRWVQNKNEDSAQKEMPLKREDDAMDMIRYFATSYQPKKPALVRKKRNWDPITGRALA
jgi:PBSX family phage terminase large subunit